jgi:hypothetical protein
MLRKKKGANSSDKPAFTNLKVVIVEQTGIYTGVESICLFLMTHLPRHFFSYMNAVKSVQPSVFAVDPLHVVKSFLINTLAYAGQR